MNAVRPAAALAAGLAGLSIGVLPLTASTVAAVPCAEWQQMHPGWPCIDTPSPPPVPPPSPPTTPPALPTPVMPGQPPNADAGGSRAGALTPPPVGPGNGTPIIDVPGAPPQVLPGNQPSVPSVLPERVAPGPGRLLPGPDPDVAADSEPESLPAPARPAPETGPPIPPVLPAPAVPVERARPDDGPETDRRDGALAFLLLTGAAGFVAGGRLRGSRQGNSSSRFGGLIKQVNSKPEASAGGGGTRPGTGQSSMGTMGLLTGVDPVPQQQPGVGGLPDVIDIVNQGTPAPGTGRTLPSGTDVYTDPRGSSTQWSTPGGQSFSTETTTPRTPPPSSAQQPSVTPQQLTGLEPMPTQQQGPMDLIDVLALTKQGPIKPNTTTELPSGYTIENTTTTTENGVTVSTNTYRYPGADTTSRTEYTRTFNEPFNGEGTSYDATVDENGNLTSVTVHGSPTIRQIVFNPDHSYTVTGVDGTTQRFDPTGRPIKNLPTELDDPRSQATKDWLREGWHTATSFNRFIQNLQGARGVDGLEDDAEILGNAATAYGEWTLKNKDNPTANAELLTRFGQKLFRYDELVEYGPQYWQQKIGLDIGAAVVGGEAGGSAKTLFGAGDQAADAVGASLRGQPGAVQRANPMEMIPGDASVRTLKPDPNGGVQEGVEYKWLNEDGQTVRLRIHGPDGTAPDGSNSAVGPTYRLQIGGRYMDLDGNLFPRGVHNPNSPNYDPGAANATHIPWPAQFPLPWKE